MGKMGSNNMALHCKVLDPLQKWDAYLSFSADHDKKAPIH